MNKPKRFASLFALLVAFIMLSSVLFIALEADHDCCGDDCAVCAQIQACEDLLRNLMMVPVLAAAVWCLYALNRVLSDAGYCAFHPHTLVVLKIKLSD